MTELTAPIFTDADAARVHLEAQVWPNGPTCPHCGNANQDRITALKGKSHRPGLYQCSECTKQFTVTVGTVFERSKVPLNKWLLATYLLNSSKKGFSAHQLHRTLGVTYKTAWFMFHRIREAMRDGEFAPMGGAGGTVEIDETYLGKTEDAPKEKPKAGRNPYRNTVLTLVERGGSARSFHIGNADLATIKPIVEANVARETAMMTDQAAWYVQVGKEFASHDSVSHNKDEYVRYEDAKIITTNTVEGYYSIFKRGMKGVYQHCKEKHLHRYLAEFDHRYSYRIKLGHDDQARTDKALAGIVGKRLMYRRFGEEATL
jgi:transposase-like protein